MKPTQSILILVITLLFCSGCGLKPKAPEFRRVENLEPSYKSGDINIKGDIIMYNPNAIDFDIITTDIDVLINQKIVTNIDKLDVVNAKTKSEFVVPLDVSFEAEKVYKGFLSSAIGLIASKTVTFKLEGEITYEVKGISFTKEVNEIKELKISR